MINITEKDIGRRVIMNDGDVYPLISNNFAAVCIDLGLCGTSGDLSDVYAFLNDVDLNEIVVNTDDGFKLLRSQGLSSGALYESADCGELVYQYDIRSVDITKIKQRAAAKEREMQQNSPMITEADIGKLIEFKESKSVPRNLWSGPAIIDRVFLLRGTVMVSIDCFTRGVLRYPREEIDKMEYTIKDREVTTTKLPDPGFASTKQAWLHPHLYDGEIILPEGCEVKRFITPPAIDRIELTFTVDRPEPTPRHLDESIPDEHLDFNEYTERVRHRGASYKGIKVAAKDPGFTTDKLTGMMTYTPEGSEEMNNLPETPTNPWPVPGISMSEYDFKLPGDPGWIENPCPAIGGLEGVEWIDPGGCPENSKEEYQLPTSEKIKEFLEESRKLRKLRIKGMY